MTIKMEREPLLSDLSSWLIFHSTLSSFCCTSFLVNWLCVLYLYFIFYIYFDFFSGHLPVLLSLAGLLTLYCLSVVHFNHAQFSNEWSVGRSVGRFAKWLARKTPLRKPNRGEGFFSTKPTPKSVYDFLDGWCVRSLLFPAIRGVLKKWTWLQVWVKVFDRLWNWLTKVFYLPTDLPPASLKLRPYKFDYYYYISVRCYLYGVFKKRPCSAVTVASKPKKCC